MFITARYVLEKKIIQYEKTLHDLRYLLICKKDGLIPTFAKPKLSIQADIRARRDIAKLIVKTELKNKHRLRNKLKREIAVKSQKIKDGCGFLLFNALKFKIRSKIGSLKLKWRGVHERKLNRLRATPQQPIVGPRKDRARMDRTCNVVHNFSSCILSDEELKILSYSLDHYVPGKAYGKRTAVEFERFYQEILEQASTH